MNYIAKMNEGDLSDGILQDLKTHIVNVTIVVHHLVIIIDIIKHDLHNCTPLHDVSEDIEVLINGIQGLKTTIGTHPRLPYDTLWSNISDISLVVDSYKLALIES